MRESERTKNLVRPNTLSLPKDAAWTRITPIGIRSLPEYVSKESMEVGVVIGKSIPLV